MDLRLDYTKSLTLLRPHGELRHFARTSDLSTSNPPPPPPNWTFSCSRGELSYFVCTSDLDTTDPHTPHHNRPFSWHRQYNWHSSRSRKVVQGNNSCKIAVSVYILLNTSLSVTFNEPKLSTRQCCNLKCCNAEIFSNPIKWWCNELIWSPLTVTRWASSSFRQMNSVQMTNPFVFISQFSVV